MLLSTCRVRLGALEGAGAWRSMSQDTSALLHVCFMLS